VSAGTYRLPLPMPNDGLRAVNVYAIETDDGLLLIDGGWALREARAALEKALGSIGHPPAAIRRIVVTHVHRDHYTQAVTLRREFGSRIALGRADRGSLEQAIASPGLSKSSIVALRRGGAEELIAPLLASGWGTAEGQSDWELPDEWLHGGEQIHVTSGRRLQVIHTPGHTRGHMVFADSAAGLLFSGDHVLPHITPSIGFEAAPAQLPLRDYLQSLHLVRAMADMVMLPAHGQPGPSVHARVDELLDHHRQRLDQCLAAVRSTAATGHQVACQLRWTGRGRRFDDLDVFNKMLAVSETLAHLDVLVAEGRLASDNHGDIRLYHT